MRASLPFVSFLTAAFAFATAGCIGSGDDSCTTGATASILSEAGAPDAGSVDATVDARTDAAPLPGIDAGDSAAPSAVASVRIANWSSDAPPIDFCLAPHGTTAFQGPELANLTAQLAAAGGGDAGEGAQAFPGASAYFRVAPAQYDARLVAGGAADCSTGITPDSTNLPPVPVGQALTIGLVGAAHPSGTQSGLRTIGLRDDTAGGNAVALRAINASPDLSLIALGTLASGAFQTLFPSVAFGFGASAPAGDASVDSNDYLASPAFAETSFAVRPAGKSGYSTVSKPLSIAAGAVVTMVVVGLGQSTTTDAGVPGTVLVECVDNAGTLGNAGSCSVVSSP